MADIKFGGKTFSGVEKINIPLADGSGYVTFGQGGDSNTSDATARASDIRLGRTAYVNGEKITGILEIPATSIELSDTEVFLDVDGTATLAVYIYPSASTDEAVVWQSDDEQVATVTDGVVAYTGYGTCSITASIPSRGLSASCIINCAAPVTDIMSYFKYLGATTYSPGTYTAWCPTGLIYDEQRDVYAHFMFVQNTHYMSPNACELWFNTINPETLEHSEPVFVARTAEQVSGYMTSAGALGCCIKNGNYYMFGDASKGYYLSTDGGETWVHMEYETAPDKCPWGCYVLSNGRMIMGSDTQNHKVYYSDDNGKNWTAVQSTYFNEPTFIDFGDGVVMAICRENMDSNKNIQKPWMHVSNDYGTTWGDAVRMETVGYMGNNNCNAYVHDGYVELFVGCRIPTASPQYTDTLYKIDQYVMQTGKGAVDDFEFVNAVYQYKNDDNPQGITSTFTGADEFSTPCIAIKDKSHALLVFYAPTGANVTHNLIAVGNVPVDDFSIPKPMPETFGASQKFEGNNETVVVCESLGVTYKDGYPFVGGNAYLLLDDIEDGGYLHVQTAYRSYNNWSIPIMTNVKDLAVFAGYRDTYLPATPMPSGASSPVLRAAVAGVGAEWYPTDGTVADIYARFKDNAWWHFYEGSWIRNYTCDEGIAIPEDATGKGLDNGYMIPYTVGGLTTYKTFTPARSSEKIFAIEYDKAQ